MNDFSIKIIKADICSLSVDAIINSANPSLLAGGGICGAIHRAAGLELEKECRTLGECKKGEAVITKAYNLPSKFVIHTVGPKYFCENGKEEELLRSCYQNVLRVAMENNFEVIAIPSISTGIYGYPKREATKIAFSSIRNYLRETETSLKEIIFVVFSDDDEIIYNEIKNIP